eukprot:Phypoly_transcript_06319.p1 GENE.Phypoly_transcript_06319~~Phypoly_transcript_06319.p1  ORF type:complete len:536 (+),score=103.31 Phypoly_transcript_06319:136-1743(+)
MADKTGELIVNVDLEKEAVSSGSAHELVLLTSIKAPLVENEARESRAPIDLVAVIDRSGSMGGPKIELVLKTMAFVVEQLKETDQLCLIAYDTNVSVKLPLTYMTAIGKKLATETLATIKVDSSTNLSGGLLKGIEELMHRTHKNEVASIMLFTDGQANVGLTKTPEIVKAIGVNLENVDTACSIFSFGYGQDHDENMLKEIAEAGKGLYYFIETLDDIPRSFGDCLGGLLSVAAQNITLRIEGVNGISLKGLISKVKGAEEVKGPVVEINLGDIYSEESRDIVGVMSIPPGTTNPEFFPAVNVVVSYFNVRTSSIIRKQVTAYLKRPESTPDNQPPNLVIDKQRNRLITAQAIEQATSLYKPLATHSRGYGYGNRRPSSLSPISSTLSSNPPAPVAGGDTRAQARTILETAINAIKKSPSANEPFSQALVEDLRCSLNEVTDNSMAYEAVQKKMVQKAYAHSRQRGHGSSDMYDNSKKTKMKEQASSYSMSACDSPIAASMQTPLFSATSYSLNSNNNNNNNNNNSNNNNNNNV